MGAHSIEFTIPVAKVKTVASLRKWYDQAREDALWEDGHNPYNGTISTTNGILIEDKRIFKGRHGSGNLQDAVEYCLEHTRKWDEVRAVKARHKGKLYWVVAGWAAS